MNWDDYQSLGGALHDAYPDANYLTMTDDALLRLVIALPDFEGGAPSPDAAALAAVRFAWIAAAEGEDDTGPYDGSA
jgi:FeS assembly protein IscX